MYYKIHKCMQQALIPFTLGRFSGRILGPTDWKGNVLSKVCSAPFSNSSDGRKKIVVFLSSIRPNRMADRVAMFVQRILARHSMDAIFFDPLNMKFELVRIPIHYYPNPSDAPEWLQEANKQLRAADGFIVLTAEYNTFPPPPLTNMLSHFPADSYRHRPCGIISYTVGSIGGFRASTLLRPIICELCIVSIGQSVPIPFVQNIFNPDGTCSSELVEANTNRLMKEIAWYSDAFNNHMKLMPPIFT